MDKVTTESDTKKVQKDCTVNGHVPTPCETKEAPYADFDNVTDEEFQRLMSERL